MPSISYRFWVLQLKACSVVENDQVVIHRETELTVQTSCLLAAFCRMEFAEKFTSRTVNTRTLSTCTVAVGGKPSF